MSDWTGEQWMEWYDTVLSADVAWQQATTPHAVDVSQLPENTAADMEELRELARAIDSHQHNFLAELMGRNVSGVRGAFEQLSPEFKQRLYAWHHRHSTVLPEDESIVSELGEIVIGVAGSDGSPTPDAPDIADDEWPIDESLDVNITLPNDNVASVTGRPGADPEVRIDGVELAERERKAEVAAAMAKMPPEPAGDPGDAELAGCLSPFVKIAVGVAAGAALIGGVVLATNGDDDAAVQSPPPIDENSDFVDSGADIDEVETFRGDDPDIENDPAVECAALETHELTFSSPDAPDGFMGDDWFRTSLRERGWPSPSFEWSGVPDEATELAIVITTITPDKRIEVESDPDADFRVGSPLFILTDIDPSVTSLASALGGAKIEGATMRDHGAASVELDGGVTVQDVYLGLDSAGEMLFTLLAMCNPPDNFWEPAALPWMGGSIAHDSFVVYMG